MYNNISYEEYMKEVLGYKPIGMQDTFSTNDYYIMQTNNSGGMRNFNEEKLYPDIYKKVYPLVCQECNRNTMPVTNEILEQMTDNVYNSINIDLKIETNVKMDARKDNANSRQQEDRQTLRNNNTLRDLIKILILNQLLGGGHSNRPRPPFPERPPMPGPGRPPMPGPRPPFPGGPRPRQQKRVKIYRNKK